MDKDPLDLIKMEQDTSYTETGDRDTPEIKWEQAKHIIETNQLELFKRSKAGMDEYHKFKEQLVSKGISRTAILLGQDLHWAEIDDNFQILKTHLKPKSNKLLHDANDIFIIENRFPYHFEAGIYHLLIWTKVPIESDPISSKGDISPYTRRLINKFISNTFAKGLGIKESDVLWFRNWQALQSIRELSHIHVLVKAPHAVVAKVLNTSGCPLSEDDYKEISQL